LQRRIRSRLKFLFVYHRLLTLSSERPRKVWNFPVPGVIS
jgi:hypothetical protein